MRKIAASIIPCAELMKIYSYSNPAHLPAEGSFTNESPVQFLKGFSEFYKEYHGNEVSILYSESLDAWIPVRYQRIRMFRFAQILHAPINANNELEPGEQQQFFEELVRFHRDRQLCQRFIQPHPYGILKAVPAGAQACPFGTYIHHLDQLTDDGILQSFDQKYRKSVNHALKNGAVIRFGNECFQDFYKLYSETTRRAGIHCDPTSYFDSLIRCLGPEHTEISVVYDGDVPVGAIFMLYSNYAALCTHAGSGGETKLYGAMKLLHYETMKRLKSKGVRLYDLVGVRINSNNDALEGIFRFKKGFGGELKEGYLWKMDIAPVQTKVFDLMMRLRNRNRTIKDIIDEETN
jgi:hypothetical protein